MNAVLVENYQLALLYLFITDSKFRKKYQEFLFRYYKILLSNKYLKDIFIITAKKIVDGSSLDAVRTYIDQAENDGRLDSDDADLYRDYIKRIDEAKNYVEDFKVNFLSFFCSRLVLDNESELLRIAKNSPYTLTHKLRSLQKQVINAISSFSDEEFDIDKIADEIVGLRSELIIPFGWNIDHCNGLRKHELGIIASGTGCGKSWILLHSFWKAFKEGRKILFISLEMSKAQIYDRFITLYTGNVVGRSFNLPYTDDLSTIKFHYLDKYDGDIKELIKKIFTEFTDNGVRIVFSGIADGSSNIFYHDNILTELAKYEAVYGYLPDAIFIDGIEFIQYRSLGVSEPWKIEARVVSWLKELARDSGFAIFVNSHIQKTLKGKWVYTGDLSGGAEKGRVADLVLTMSATHEELKYSLRRLLIAKNRMDPSGDRYWFALLPTKDGVVSELYEYKPEYGRNLDEKLLKLKMNDFLEVTEVDEEYDYEDVPF